jgi:hypothetical protein
MTVSRAFLMILTIFDEHTHFHFFDTPYIAERRGFSESSSFCLHRCPSRFSPTSSCPFRRFQGINIPLKANGAYRGL